jgi:hypothetical protein
MRGDNLFRESDGRDPVAELARTTGRADPPNENAPTNNWLGESPPLAPADYPSAPERAYECHRHDDALSERPYGQRDRAYDVNYGTEEYTIEMSPEPQLIRLVLVIAIFVAGTGIAFGYRAMFGSSTSPTLPPITHPTKGSKEIVRVSPMRNPITMAALAKSVQRLPFQLRTWSRMNNWTRARWPAWARRPRLFHLLLVRRCRTEQCRSA